MSTPARVGLKFNDLDEMLGDASKLREGPYEKAGKWDLAYILAHLAKTMVGPFEYKGMGIPWPISVVVRFFYHRIAQSGKYPSIQLPMPKFFKPDEGIALDRAWEQFSAAVEKLKSLNGSTMACPPVGRLRVDDFRQMQLLHGAHHLSFLRSSN